SRGIGPAYEDKIGRRGIRMCDLLGDRDALAHEVRENVHARNQIIKESTLDWKPLFDQLVAHGERLRPWVGDVSLFLAKLRAADGNVMYEGAQASCATRRASTVSTPSRSPSSTCSTACRTCASARGTGRRRVCSRNFRRICARSPTPSPCTRRCLAGPAQRAASPGLRRFLRR